MTRHTKLLVAAVTLMGLIAIPVFTHSRARARLESYHRGLNAKGEKLDLADLRPVISVTELKNGAELAMAAGRIRYAFTSAPAMRVLAPGRAMAAAREEVLPTDESSNIWPQLEWLLGQNETALDQLRLSVMAGRFAFPVDYTPGNFSLPHLAQVKSMAQWLSMEGLVDLHREDFTNAGDNLVACGELVAGYDREVYMISELVRVAMAAIALNVTWEALQSRGWTDEQLSSIKAPWQKLDLLSQAESVLAMERLFASNSFAVARISYSGAVAFTASATGPPIAALAQLGKELLDNPGTGIKNALRRYPGYWGWKYWQSYEDELVNSKSLQAAIEAVRHARNAHIPDLMVRDFEVAAHNLKNEYPTAGKWLEYSSMELIARFLTRIRVIEIQRALLVAAISLEQYRLKHGTYPADLAALCPEFASAAPRDPIDGAPLRYRLNHDGTFLLYSIGENRRDDGGNPELPREAPRQWWRAKDAVWPQPASPELVQVEKDKALERLRNQMNANSSVTDALRRRYGLLPQSPSQGK